MTRLLSTEGLYSLDPDDDWRWEQTSEDGSLVLHRPDGHGLVRIAETLDSADIEDLMPDGEPCSLNGFKARCRALTRGDERPMYLRVWVVADGRSVVHVTHEAPAEAPRSADVDRLLATLTLHHDPHPTVAALLQRLHDDPAVTDEWVWHPRLPLVIAAPSRGQEVSVETLVRAAAVHPQQMGAMVGEEARRIRNLAVFTSACPPFDQVGDSVLPLIRSGVVQESVDDRMRSVEQMAEMKPRLVCGDDLVRRFFAPGLFVYFGIDVPGAFHFITPAVRARWAVGAAEIEAQSLLNLTRKLEGDRVDAVKVGDGHHILVLEDGEGLAASRLLLEPFRRMLARRLGVPYRLAIPSAGVLIAFSRDFVEWRDFLGEDTWDAYLHEPVPLTAQIYENAGDNVFFPVDELEGA